MPEHQKLSHWDINTAVDIPTVWMDQVDQAMNGCVCVPVIHGPWTCGKKKTNKNDFSLRQTLPFLSCLIFFRTVGLFKHINILQSSTNFSEFVSSFRGWCFSLFPAKKKTLHTHRIHMYAIYGNIYLNISPIHVSIIIYIHIYIYIIHTDPSWDMGCCGIVAWCFGPKKWVLFGMVPKDKETCFFSR